MTKKLKLCHLIRLVKNYEYFLRQIPDAKNKT